MPNDQAHDTRTTVAEDRVAAAVSLSVAGVVASVSNLPAANMVVDTFESANFSVPNGPAPLLNTVGFEWYNLTSASIVRADQFVVNNGSTVNIGPISGKEWENNPITSGQHSMRLRYEAEREMTEISFRFSEYQTELYFRYWMRVPINYTKQSLNDKFFSIFPTRATYDRLGTLTIQTRPNGSGGASLVYQDGGVLVGETGSTPFISVPSDRGRWMQVVLHFKRASTSSANDGVYRSWRRWEDETAFTLLHSKTNANLFNSDDANGFKQGYVFGWANDPYTVETEFLIDDFEVSSSPLVPVGTEGL